MKGILVIVDGMADLPCKQLNGKTPLEMAEMPNLEFLSTRGKMGMMYPVKPGFVPESDEAIVSIFGNNLIDSTRGQLETRGTDLKLTRGDLALRVNFATIDNLKDRNIKDRRAGRTLTTAEAEILAKALNKIKLPCKFEFKPTVQHRAVLVLRGGFSDNVSSNDSTYSKEKAKEAEKIKMFQPLDDEDNTQYTVNLLKEFVTKAFDILDTHPINEERRKKGLLPANYLLMRGAGIEPPKLKIYKKWLSIVSMPLEIGFSRVSGMQVFSFDYPKLKNLDSYGNLRAGLRKMCDYSIKVLKKNYKKHDYAYIHIKETDLPGHDNKPIEKKLMLEHIDKTFFRFLRKFAPPHKIKVVVTADHSTPCKLKAHSADPVPVLLYNVSPPKTKKIKLSSIPFILKNSGPKIPFYPKKKYSDKEEKQEETTFKFSEKNAKKGTLGFFMGKDLLDKVGFLK